MGASTSCRGSPEISVSAAMAARGSSAPTAASTAGTATTGIASKARVWPSASIDPARRGSSTTRMRSFSGTAIDLSSAAAGLATSAPAMTCGSSARTISSIAVAPMNGCRLVAVGCGSAPARTEPRGPSINRARSTSGRTANSVVCREPPRTSARTPRARCGSSGTPVRQSAISATAERSVKQAGLVSGLRSSVYGGRPKTGDRRPS